MDLGLTVCKTNCIIFNTQANPESKDSALRESKVSHSRVDVLLLISGSIRKKTKTLLEIITFLFHLVVLYGFHAHVTLGYGRNMTSHPPYLTIKPFGNTFDVHFEGD